MEDQNQPQGENLLKIILEVVGGLLILSIFLMVGYFGDYLGKKEGQQPVSQEESSQNEEPQVTLPKVLYNLAGPIQELQKDYLIFDASIPQINDAGQLVPKTEVRKVLIAPATKFSRLAFVAQAGTNQKTPQETVIAFKDLKVKDYIEVVSNQDIYEAQEFQAIQIRVLPR